MNSFTYSLNHLFTYKYTTKSHVYIKIKCMNSGSIFADKIKSILKNRIFIYVLLLGFCIFLASSSQDYDYDLYARFIVGENFFEKGVFNYRDYLSYTPTHEWFDHEYGASLVYYLFFKYLGVLGLVLIQGLLIFFTGFFIIKTQQIQKHAYPVSLVLMGIFFILFEHQNPSLVRCHLFSFMFFAMFLYFLEKTRLSCLKGKPSKILWLVPPLVIVWNNLHGGVVSGLGIIFIYMIGALISRQNWHQYFKVLIVSTPLLAINPYGFDYINFLVSANLKDREMITEWWNTFIPRHSLYYFPQFAVGAFAGLLVITDFLYKKRFNIIKFLVLCTTLYLGGIHVKLLSLPMIATFALYHNEIMSLFSKNIFKIAEKLAFVALIISIACIPMKQPDVAKTDTKKFPVKEVEFIKINDIKGNILTEFALGSYVSYKLYPNNLIYMDGRYEEVYNDREFNNLMNFEKTENDWQAVLRDYPTEILLLNKDIPVYSVLNKMKDWVKIYEGEASGLFVKKNKVKRYYKMPSDDIEYYRKNEFTNNGYFGKENKDK